MTNQFLKDRNDLLKRFQNLKNIHATKIAYWIDPKINHVFIQINRKPFFKIKIDIDQEPYLPDLIISYFEKQQKEIETKENEK